jgi:predicted  nucleic acid-binding Zn-ribbon protein
MLRGSKFQISNLRSQISNLKSQISNLKSQISDRRSQIAMSEYQIADGRALRASALISALETAADSQVH